VSFALASQINLGGMKLGVIHHVFILILEEIKLIRIDITIVRILYLFNSTPRSSLVAFSADAER